MFDGRKTSRNNLRSGEDGRSMCRPRARRRRRVLDSSIWVGILIEGPANVLESFEQERIYNTMFAAKK